MTHEFETSREAWAFMRECDQRGIPCGYPSFMPNREGLWEVDAWAHGEVTNKAETLGIMHDLAQKHRILLQSANILNRRSA